MSFINKMRGIDRTKFSFGKNNEYIDFFNRQVGAISMNNPNFGLNIDSNLPLEYQLRGVFNRTLELDGFFLFNISSVDLLKAKEGFKNFEEASGNNYITEWELSMILENGDYFKSTIFHNGKVELVLTRNGIKIKWK